ncbi:CLUMA_CG018887, isoform A [Clunio marinus]|uniref:Large ribosomal subunit protein uL29m n=1 Tax=Clunio marinus TaxID=568069 RepID=A0A1J1J598_9DIPT|nr:CLUMA_CG018887, isoform A [Clunio marinus]
MSFYSFLNVAKRVTISCPHLCRRILLNNHVKEINVGKHLFSSKPEDVTTKLMGFFDNKKNWGENEVKHGRNWTLPELRIKSNQDLHKLWFVLLKERNMLLTMEHECKRDHRLFPSPERLDKVKISMENLETVVKERNKAYHELETGETGQRPEEVRPNLFQIPERYRSKEYPLPAHLNKDFTVRKLLVKRRIFRDFLRKYREQDLIAKKRARNRDRNEVIHLLKRNPDLDKQMLQEKYPTVDIPMLEKKDKFRGHYVPKL